MKAKPTPAPAAQAAPQDPQVGGRFQRLPDGTLRPIQAAPATAPDATATPAAPQPAATTPESE